MNFKKFFIFTFSSVIYLSCSSPAKSKLNILMIIVDDMRPDISAWGKENIKTPNIDHLVNQGLSFKRAYAQYANCSPSRMSFLTGISPHRLGHEGRLSDKKQFETNSTITFRMEKLGVVPLASLCRAFVRFPQNKQTCISHMYTYMYMCLA